MFGKIIVPIEDIYKEHKAYLTSFVEDMVNARLSFSFVKDGNYIEKIENHGMFVDTPRDMRKLLTKVFCYAKFDEEDADSYELMQDFTDKVDAYANDGVFDFLKATGMKLFLTAYDTKYPGTNYPNEIEPAFIKALLKNADGNYIYAKKQMRMRKGFLPFENPSDQFEVAKRKREVEKIQDYTKDRAKILDQKKRQQKRLEPLIEPDWVPREILDLTGDDDELNETAKELVQAGLKGVHLANTMKAIKNTPKNTQIIIRKGTKPEVEIEDDFFELGNYNKK